MKPTRKINRALVLGGTGFIGQRVVNELSNRRIRTMALIHHRVLPATISNDVTPVHGSLLNYDWEQLPDVDVIFHLARIPGKGAMGRRVAAEVSRFANRRLLNWLSRQPDPPLVIMVAGTLAYGSHGDEFVDENTTLQPISFARQYAIGEKPFVRAASRKELPVVIARPAWVYGPGSWFDGYYCRHIRELQQVPLYGKGKNWMSFVHVDDCAKILVEWAISGKCNTTVNIFCGKPHRQVDFAHLLAGLKRLPVKFFDIPDMKKNFDPATYEAFQFSLKAASIHQDFYDNFRFQHPDLKAALAAILKEH